MLRSLRINSLLQTSFSSGTHFSGMRSLGSRLRGLGASGSTDAGGLSTDQHAFECRSRRRRLPAVTRFHRDVVNDPFFQPIEQEDLGALAHFANFEQQPRTQAVNGARAVEQSERV